MDSIRPKSATSGQVIVHAPVKCWKTLLARGTSTFLSSRGSGQTWVGGRPVMFDPLSATHFYKYLNNNNDPDHILWRQVANVQFDICDFPFAVGAPLHEVPRHIQCHAAAGDAPRPTPSRRGSGARRTPRCCRPTYSAFKLAHTPLWFKNSVHMWEGLILNMLSHS